MTPEHQPYDLDAQADTKLDRELRERTAHENASADLLWLMGQHRGRRVMHAILRDAGLDEGSFNSNALVMAKLEGRKELARGFRRLIDRLCPELYVKMMQENEKNGSVVASGRTNPS